MGFSDLRPNFGNFDPPLKFLAFFGPPPSQKRSNPIRRTSCPAEQAEADPPPADDVTVRPGVTIDDVIDDVISGQKGWTLTFRIKTKKSNSTR